jgi:hypothetical protein
MFPQIDETSDERSRHLKVLFNRYIKIILNSYGGLELGKPYDIMSSLLKQ